MTLVGKRGCQALPLALVWALLGHSASASPGASAYLRDGVGARWTGMGGAAVAAVDDVHSAFFNPAGLSRMGTVSWQVGSMYAFQTLERSTSSLSVSHQTDLYGSFGLSWVHRYIAGLEYVDDAGHATGTTSSSEDAVIASLGYDPLYQVRIGSSVKVLHHALFGSVASGFGLDLGLQIQPILSDDLWLGLALTNVAGSLHWDGGSDAPSSAMVGGFAWRMLHGLVLVAADVVSASGAAGTTVRAGAEIRPMSLVAVRLGWDGFRPTVGGSYVWKPYQFDYAFAYDPDGLSSRHLLSFLLHF